MAQDVTVKKEGYLRLYLDITKVSTHSTNANRRKNIERYPDTPAHLNAGGNVGIMKNSEYLIGSQIPYDNSFYFRLSGRNMYYTASEVRDSSCCLSPLLTAPRAQ